MQIPTTIFFVDRPGFNRVHGRADLVYDPWLYPVFESIKLAEPRSAWLGASARERPGSGRRDELGGIANRRRQPDRCPRWDTSCALRIGPGSCGCGKRGQETILGCQAAIEVTSLALTTSGLLMIFLEEARGEKHGYRTNKRLVRV